MAFLFSTGEFAQFAHYFMTSKSPLRMLLKGLFLTALFTYLVSKKSLIESLHLK